MSADELGVPLTATSEGVAPWPTSRHRHMNCLGPGRNLHKRITDTVTEKESATPAEPADRIDSYIDAAAEMLALPVEPAWKPAVKANLLINLRLAAAVAEFVLPDEAEPAPVFKA